MYPRVKRISGRQYVYLVEGVRNGKKISQKTLGYLGPLSVVTLGIPPSVREEMARNLGRPIDWKQVTERIAKMPVRFDDFAIKRRGLSARFLTRNEPPTKTRRRLRPDPSNLLLQREVGELEALARLSKRSFQSMFDQAGPYAYRFKTR